MSPPLFEVSNGVESQIEVFLNAQGYDLRMTSEKRHAEEDVFERYWSIVAQDSEVFCFSIAEQKNNRILIWGPLKDRRHELITRQLAEEIQRIGGKPVKPTELFKILAAP